MEKLDPRLAAIIFLLYIRYLPGMLWERMRVLHIRDKKKEIAKRPPTWRDKILESDLLEYLRAAREVDDDELKNLSDDELKKL